MGRYTLCGVVCVFFSTGWVGVEVVATVMQILAMSVLLNRLAA